MLNTDYREVENLVSCDEVIYTGPIDEYFDFRFGKLPYRSLDFHFETFDKPVFQDAPVINYPNENPYTRCTEFKYLTGQQHPQHQRGLRVSDRGRGSVLSDSASRRTPRCTRNTSGSPRQTPHVHFTGRLATYKYYNMDQVVGQSLALYRKLAGLRRPVPVTQTA